MLRPRLVFPVLLVLLLAAVSAPAATVFRVTSDADSGPGSLRDAIEQANASCRGTDCQILGDGNAALLVRLVTPLPPITACNLVIDSGSFSIYTGHRAIELDGSALTRGNGFEIRTACPAGVRGVTIRGFAIGGFPENGMYLATNDAAPGSSRTFHRIEENAVGLEKLGEDARPNGQRGVAVESTRTCARIEKNYIAANRRSGVAIWASAPDTFIVGNLIGWGNWLRPHPNGNGASGIFIGADDVAVESNNIAFNHQFGVSIAPGVKRAGVRGNTIHSNGERAIDWNLDGETPNDPEETDGVPNAPILTSFRTYKSGIGRNAEDASRISGILRSRTGVYGNRFTINLYVNNGPGLAGRFEAFDRHLSFDVPPPNDGLFEVAFESPEMKGGFFRGLYHGLTFTAQLVVTDESGRSWTSELSAPFTVP